MKKAIFTIAFSLLPLIIHCQIWTYSQGENPFDGKYKTCSIIGQGSEFPYKNPLFVINVFKGTVEDPNIYLANVPYAVCANNHVLIKFDNDTIYFESDVTTSNGNGNWFLHSIQSNSDFYNTEDDSIKSILIKYTIPKYHSVRIYKEASIKSFLIFESKEYEELFLYDHNLETGYWRCVYKNQEGFVWDKEIIDFYKNSKVTDQEVYTPIKINVRKSDYKDLFVEAIKNHSIMNIRLTSDCLKTDFRFRLKGSTKAINFIFSK